MPRGAVGVVEEDDVGEGVVVVDDVGQSAGTWEIHAVASSGRLLVDAITSAWVGWERRAFWVALGEEENERTATVTRTARRSGRSTKESAARTWRWLWTPMAGSETGLQRRAPVQR
ncbi:hypothetical protein VTK73DRAFT_4507 [Phialemonium thermophilum]|uniref:Uncharacterized protein n=1 Tax=Phialemonium thermophilum TaxID=223376 RepID=A0ABR3V860_9PEZI